MPQIDRSFNPENHPDFELIEYYNADKGSSPHHVTLKTRAIQAYGMTSYGTHKSHDRFWVHRDDIEEDERSAAESGRESRFRRGVPCRKCPPTD